MNVTFITHRGAVRDENQDSVFVSGIVRTGDMDAPEVCDLKPAGGYPMLFAVIDGMGGHKGGALAAEILADTLAKDTDKKSLFSTRPDTGKDELALRGLLAEAVRRMEKEAEADHSLSEMGAAVSGVLLREKTALAFNCGDCRVYRLSDGRFERVTRDHSIVQELFERGEISEEEMRKHPRKNVITSVVSPAWGGEFDLYVNALPLCGADDFFICSDGVWEMFSSRKLAELLTQGATPLDTANELFAALLAANCRDNVSFIHCRIGR